MDRNLQREIGSLFLLGFKGSTPPDGFLRLLDRYRPRTVIIFRDNIPHGSNSLPPLVKRLSEAAGEQLTIFMDEEGGWIQQLPELPWPALLAQGRSGPESVERCHRAMGVRLAELGVAVVCGPVADLDDGRLNPVIGSRAFGSDPAAVSPCVAAAVRGLAAGGVKPVLKHFPGHGDSREDSHFTLPTVPADRRQALIPFGAGLEAGAEAVMSAHLRLGEEGDPHPATFRRDIMHDLLVGELGFEGLVVTDALEMGGTSPVPLCDRGTMALAAGCHLLTVARWAPELDQVLGGMADPLTRGTLPVALVERAQERLERFLTKPLPGGSAPEGSLPLERIATEAIVCPGGGELPRWDGSLLEIEFGPIGSWERDEFLTLLTDLPHSVIEPESEITGETYLYIGRTEPAGERLEQLRRRLLRNRAPLVIACGPWGWTLPFPRRAATLATGPAGVSGLLGRLRDL